MSSKLSVEDVLPNLEARCAFHAEQEALHAQKTAHHREQRALHAAEFEKVRQHHLEAFRAATAPAQDLARLPFAPPPCPAPLPENQAGSGRLMVSLLPRRVAVWPVGRRALWNDRGAGGGQPPLRRPPDGLPATSDVLRHMEAQSAIRLVREGNAFHEALCPRA